MLTRKMKPVAIVVGAAFAASLTAGAVADEAADPFAAEELEDVLFADAHKGEGKCGEGKCGDEGEDGDSEEGEDSSEDSSEDAES